ncbi:uncharacterized protein LOC127289702 isoform X2 [Leptopilina boulardi]|uniref:uncharacterized protein LOC127289702 isoform X2 n=1 Tax=Leptopilina boulardi TaxID=63433 RepID=UPI0021F5C7B8|nr:uncharacterized protein LOC127289702 isoform X2 [Leptopilina boulardi]
MTSRTCKSCQVARLKYHQEFENSIQVNLQIKRKGTPRTIKAIRQQIVKFDLNRNSTLSASNVCLGKATSVIYFNKAIEKTVSTSTGSSKSSVRLSQSERSLLKSKDHQTQIDTSPSSKVFQKQRLTASETAKLFESLTSSTRQKSSCTPRIERLTIGEGKIVEPSAFNCREIESTCRRISKSKATSYSRTLRRAVKDSVNSSERKHTRKRISDGGKRGSEFNQSRKLRQKCFVSEKSQSSPEKLMAQYPNLSSEETVTHKKYQGELGLEFLMQHMHKSNFRESADTDESKKGFPFQTTPSGNLKIIPDQVVYESKKVSVLVADPEKTQVNVNDELEKSDLEIIAQDSIQFPPGITYSTVNQLQVQERLPRITPIYRPRTQPYRSKATAHPGEMEQNLTEQKGSTPQLPSPQEIPLSSLGFTIDQPIEWEVINLPEKTDLYHELANRITNYKNADCIVKIEEDEFHCHLLVLQSYSCFFDAKNCKEIDLSGSSVTSKAFSLIYDWMITSNNESCQLLRRDNILEIFVAAQYLGIKELEEQCWAFIDNNELFSEDTAFLLYLEARKISNTAVMELMVPRIMKFFLMLVSTKDFLELAVEELCLLLKSNYICVNSEMEVLMSAVRWLMHDWENRKKNMLDVLKCVRFGLIAPWQLVDVKRNPENPEFMELMSCPEVQKMVDDGLAFVIIKYWYGNQTEDYYHWIDLLGLTEPTNRNWAGEDKNYVTYREFLSYLEDYRMKQMSELKGKNSRQKLMYPDSSINECSSSPTTKARSIFPKFCNNVDHNTHNLATNSKHNSKACPSGLQTSNRTSGMISPSEMLNFFNNMDKNPRITNPLTKASQ